MHPATPYTTKRKLNNKATTPNTVPSTIVYNSNENEKPKNETQGKTHVRRRLNPGIARNKKDDDENRNLIFIPDLQSPKYMTPDKRNIIAAHNAATTILYTTMSNKNSKSNEVRYSVDELERQSCDIVFSKKIEDRINGIACRLYNSSDDKTKINILHDDIKPVIKEYKDETGIIVRKNSTLVACILKHIMYKFNTEANHERFDFQSDCRKYEASSVGGRRKRNSKKTQKQRMITKYRNRRRRSMKLKKKRRF